MISLRQNLKKIGIYPGTPIHYRDFWLPPQSIRTLIRSLDAPGSWTETNPGTELDKDWTEEIQGCAWGHGRWFYVSNAKDSPRLHVSDGATGKKVKSWKLDAVPPAHPGFKFHHMGHIIINGEYIYIDHYFGDLWTQVLVLQGNGETISFDHWIQIIPPEVGYRVGMIAINFEKQKIITCPSYPNGSFPYPKPFEPEVFLHNMDGTYTGKRMKLTPPQSDGCNIQGGIWSPNNHLYMASGRRDSWYDYQYIYCYSPLNGHLLGTIAVPAFENKQELEGLCYADLIRKGKPVQIHVILLENEDVFSKDDIYHKSFSADKPDLI